MRSILVVNAKGGSGKSTLACNLASFFACWGVEVSLVDLDRQGSAWDWLRARPDDLAPIHGLRGKADRPLPEQGDYRILDVPSGLEGEPLDRMLELADTVIVPVLPSPVDIRAAGRFIAELLHSPTRHPQQRICVVANRCRATTRSYRALENFLTHLDIPFIARLRDTQNYLRAAEQGRGIFELPTREVVKDLVDWQPLVAWISGDPRLIVVPELGSREELAGDR